MKPKLWILVFVTLSIVGLIVWTVIDGRRAYPRSQQLPDGTVVTIKDLSYGKSVNIPMGNLWQRIAGRILPEAIAKRLRIRKAGFTSATDTIFVTVETVRTNGTFSAYPRWPYSRDSSILMTDDTGNEYQLNRVLQNGSGPKDLIEVFTAPLVSHLATQLNLRLQQYDYSSAATLATPLVAEFVVPNPAPRSRPRWTPSRPPMTNQLNDLTIVLRKVPLATPGSSSLGASPNNWSGLDVFENNSRSKNWRVLGFTIQDEEGNVLTWGGRISPLEPRKFRFELTRNSPTSPADVLSFRDVAVSTNKPSLLIVTNFHGSTIQIERSTEGQFDYSIRPRLTDFSHRLTVEYNYENGKRDTEFSIFGYSQAGAGIGFRPSHPSPIKSADITFVFTTNVIAEFLATPGSESTNSLPLK